MVITRSQIEQRRTAIPLGVIPYSQNTVSSVTHRRSDCSGLVSYVWNCPLSGPGIWLGAYSTQTFYEQKQIFQIDRKDLRPGDAIGYCGPGTSSGGGGHIALWLGTNGKQEHIWDHGSGMGPKDHWVTWGSGTGWASNGKIGAWRFAHVVEDDGTSYDGVIPTGNELNMFSKLNDGGEHVRYMQIRVKDVAPEALERFGADSGYGNETAYGLYQATGLSNATVQIMIKGSDGKYTIPKQVPGQTIYNSDIMRALDLKWNEKFGGKGEKGDPGPKGDPGSPGPKGDAAVLSPGSTLIVQ